VPNEQGEGLNLSPVTPVYYSIIMNTMHFLATFSGHTVLGSRFSYPCNLQLSLHICLCAISVKVEGVVGVQLLPGASSFQLDFLPLLSRYKQQGKPELRGRERHHGKLHC